MSARSHYVSEVVFEKSERNATFGRQEMNTLPVYPGTCIKAHQSSCLGPGIALLEASFFWTTARTQDATETSGRLGCYGATLGLLMLSMPLAVAIYIFHMRFVADGQASQGHES